MSTATKPYDPTKDHCHKCSAEMPDDGSLFCTKCKPDIVADNSRSIRKNDRERLYSTLDGNNTVKIRVPFDPLLLAVLGQFNPLKPEDRPNLIEVEKVRDALKQFGISL